MPWAPCCGPWRWCPWRECGPESASVTAFPWCCVGGICLHTGPSHWNGLHKAREMYMKSPGNLVLCSVSCITGVGIFINNKANTGRKMLVIPQVVFFFFLIFLYYWKTFRLSLISLVSLILFCNWLLIKGYWQIF